MSTAPTGWQTPKTNWTSADVPLLYDFNRIEGNINAIESGSRTIDPTQAPTGNAGTLRQLLDWFANRVRAITGKTNWYDAPDVTLATLAARPYVPSGIICMWSGLLANIPSGWVLCDGANGTPNLLDKFVKSIPNASTQPGGTGGASSHTHTIPSSSLLHTHTFNGTGPAWEDVEGSGAGARGLDQASSTVTTSSAGPGNVSVPSANHLPPYFQLAFIMKT